MENDQQQKKVDQAGQQSQKPANPETKSKKKDKGENTNESKRGRNAKKGMLLSSITPSLKNLKLKNQ